MLMKTGLLRQVCRSVRVDRFTKANEGKISSIKGADIADFILANIPKECKQYDKPKSGEDLKYTPISIRQLADKNLPICDSFNKEKIKGLLRLDYDADTIVTLLLKAKCIVKQPLVKGLYYRSGSTPF